MNGGRDENSLGNRALGSEGALLGWARDLQETSVLGHGIDALRE